MIKIIKLIARRADYLLHHIAGEDIAALFFAIVVHFLAWYWAMAIADAVAICFLVGKEIYDSKHPDTQTAELMDIISGLFGIAFIDTIICIIFLFAL